MAIDLKLRNFEAADKGQMEFYLNWLKRHECVTGQRRITEADMLRVAGKCRFDNPCPKG